MLLEAAKEKHNNEDFIKKRWKVGEDQKEQLRPRKPLKNTFKNWMEVGEMAPNSKETKGETV